jgi:hypothetical protein
MTDSNNKQDKRLFSREQLRPLASGVVIVVIFAGSIFTTAYLVRWYLGKFGLEEIEQHARLSEIGEFFGGTLGTTFGFFGLLAVLATIYLQNTELRYTRDELSRSADAFERQVNLAHRSAFNTMIFQLLSLQNELLRDLTIETDDGTLHGRDCFAHLFDSLKQQLDETVAQNPDADDLAVIDHAFQHFTNRYQSEFGHYFRSFYNVLRVIDESNPGMTNSSESVHLQRRKYSRTLRAQLSTYELLLLYYHCLWNPEESELKELVERYSMLRNLDTALLSFPGGLENDPAEPQYGRLKRQLYENPAFSMHKQNRIARTSLN